MTSALCVSTSLSCIKNVISFMVVLQTRAPIQNIPCKCYANVIVIPCVGTNGVLQEGPLEIKGKI